MKNYVLFLVSILCTSCLVSRMARPIITGRVLDYQGNPIEKCQVGEVFTDKKGYFRLPEKKVSRILPLSDLKHHQSI